MAGPLQISAWRETRQRKTNYIVETRDDLNWAQVGDLLAQWAEDYPRLTVYNRDAGGTVLIFDRDSVF